MAAVSMWSGLNGDECAVRDAHFPGAAAGAAWNEAIFIADAPEAPTAHLLTAEESGCLEGDEAKVLACLFGRAALRARLLCCALA